MERQFADANPVSGSRKRKVEVKRERTLSPDELRAVWIGVESLADPIPAFIRTLMLTGVRREEARGMRWDEVDLGTKVWVIPRNRTKNGRPHEVPRSAGCSGPQRLAPERGVRFSSTAARARGVMSGLKAQVDKGSGVTGWRLHDLRRTLRTGLAQRRPPRSRRDDHRAHPARPGSDL